MAGILHNGDIYRRLREARKLTQAQLGAKIGISESTLRRIELGGKKHRREHEDRVAEALGTTVHQVETEVAEINQAVTRVNDGALADTADTAPSRPESPPGLDLRSDKIVVLTPNREEADLSVWLDGPPSFVTVRIVRRIGNLPLVDDESIIGRGVDQFYPPEQMAALFPLLHDAWGGKRREAYFQVMVDADTTRWRRVIHYREGDFLRVDAYTVPAAHATGALDVTETIRHHSPVGTRGTPEAD